jgi:hypothetical protein
MRIVDALAVRLDGEGVPFRVPRVQTSHLDGSPLTTEDLSEFDAHTVLYDIFWRSDHDYFEGIGPPLFNLRDVLLPMRARVDGREARVVVSELTSRGLLYFRIPGASKGNGASVELRFGDVLTQRFEVRRDPPVSAGTSLTTLQKDNRTRWIADWARYYKLAHGVERIILYDNGSAELPDASIGLPEASQVVRWPFPFGPKRSHDNKFTQIGSMNHFRLRFGNRALALNFDIDELLVVKTRSIYRWMRTLPVLRFDNYKVPYVIPGSDDYSYVDFPLREPAPKGSGHKYSFWPRWVSAVYPHSAKMPLFRQRWIPTAPVAEAYFLNYLGITTNWKVSYWDRKVPPKSPEILVPDLSAIEVLLRK